MKYMGLKTVGLCLIFVGFAFTTSYSVASNLELTLASSTSSYSNPNEFNLSVTFQNTSDKQFIVFPVYVRRNYTSLDGKKAEYIPYPGPAINPWPTAIVLNGGEVKTANFKGMQNGDGIWTLEPGQYELGAILTIAPEAIFGVVPDKYKGMDIWRGSIETGVIKIHYLGDQK